MVSLLLSCMTLSFTTSRRFIPTLSRLKPAPQSASEEGGYGCELGLEGFLDFENRILQPEFRI